MVDGREQQRKTGRKRREITHKSLIHINAAWQTTVDYYRTAGIEVGPHGTEVAPHNHEILVPRKHSGTWSGSWERGNKGGRFTAARQLWLTGERNSATLVQTPRNNC